MCNLLIRLIKGSSLRRNNVARDAQSFRLLDIYEDCGGVVKVNISSNIQSGSTMETKDYYSRNKESYLLLIYAIVFVFLNNNSEMKSSKALIIRKRSESRKIELFEI